MSTSRTVWVRLARIASTYVGVRRAQHEGPSRSSFTALTEDGRHGIRDGCGREFQACGMTVLVLQVGAALEHGCRVMHRDRPIFGMQRAGREPLEVDADYSTACFPATAKLVLGAYVARFGSKYPLPLTDAVAFALHGESGQSLMRAGADSYEFASAVATATSFGRAAI